MNDNENLIPLVNLTEGSTPAEEMIRGKEEAMAKLEMAEQFSLVTIAPAGADGEQLIDVALGCTDHGMMTMVVTLLGMVGAAKLGDAANAMPAELARATAQMLGFQELSNFLRAEGERRVAEAMPRTPASDAKG